MDEVYLITGLLGYTLAKALIGRGKKVVGLRLSQDKQIFINITETKFEQFINIVLLSCVYQEENKTLYLSERKKLL